MTNARSSQGWSIYFGEIFDVQWAEYRSEVKALKASLSDAEFKAHSRVKLFAALVNIVHDVVPRDPNATEFRQGKTLGEYSDWRRVKGHGLPSRWRLFFRFSSGKKAIVFAWLNSYETQRQEGAKTDVYVVFKAMLDAGNPPSDFESLLKRSVSGK